MTQPVNETYGVTKERIEGLVEFEPNSGCWLWRGNWNENGYGQMTVRSGGRQRSRRAHRASYEAFKGPIPPGLVIDHLCRTPCCVNPQHLEAVTYRENSRRGRGGEHNKRKTHCARGHALTPDNLYTNKGKPGVRICRTCDVERARRTFARRRRQS